MPLPRWYYQGTNVFLNLLFIAYLWLVQPQVLNRLITSSQQDQPDWLMGVLLLCIPVLELAGVALKHPVSAYLALHYPRANSSAWDLLAYLLTAMFHIGASALVVIIGFQLMQIGLDEQTSGGLQLLICLVFMLVLFKEAFFVVFLVPSTTTSLFQQLYQNKIMTDQDKALLRWFDLRPPQQLTWGYAVRNFIGELCLLVASALLFTSLWDFILSQSLLHEPWPAALLEYLGASFFFLWIFMTVRAVSTMEGLVIQSTPNQRRLSMLSGVVIWLVTLLTLPR